MARLSDMPPALAEHLLALPCAEMGQTPCASGPPLNQRRVAVISTAGLGRRADAGFNPGAGDYRVLPADLPPGEIVMSHISVNYDRTGFQDDVNICFPLDRLKEMAADGEIGSVAALHYSFMGATDPADMKPSVDTLISAMQADGVNAALLIPV